MMSDAKLDIADELLVAYADGELDPEQHAMVDAALEQEPALVKRLEVFVLSHDLLREAVALEAQPSQVPEEMRAAAARLAAAMEQPSDRVITAPFGGTQSPSRGSVADSTAKRAWHSRWMTAIAASLAVCAVGALSYVVWQTGRHSEEVMQAGIGHIERGNPLYGVLESTPSAHFVTVGGQGHRARSLITFRARDGRYCREFEVISGTDVSTGLACRSQGQWRTEMQIAGAARATDAGQSYQPAGGYNERAVAAVIEQLMLGDPLGAEEESRLLSTGWR